MATTLKFYLGEESQIVTEDYSNRVSSLFSDQYKKALDLVDAYVGAESKGKKNTIQEHGNNIIAFVGDRGTGKTSCMMSVLNMLDSHMKESRKNIAFASVDKVDPSFFDENTNIIYLVVGKMFSAFKDAVDENREKGDPQERKTHVLMDAFSRVLSQISLMGKSPLSENDTDIHQLGNLLVTVDLKKSLESLVKSYLDFFDKDYLVIPVDDIDNNTAQAYLMLEQIRKYLILPNVLIFMSFKLDQMSSVAELYFTNLYDPLLSKSHVPSISILDMAQKYMLKLFPLEHRIALPDLKTMMEKELEVYDSRDEGNVILSGSSMKYTMTALIFKKTRYLFYHATGETNQIVPTNLREYRNLLSMLCNMEDYRTNKVEYNKQQFRDYFFGEWIERHLNADGRKIAQELIENTEADRFNKLVVSRLFRYPAIDAQRVVEFQELVPKEDYLELMDSRNRRVSLSEARSMRLQSEYYRVLDSGNMPFNVSIGDVFSLLNEWKKYVVSEEDRALLFFVESLYSIKLYHYYDECTEPNIEENSKNAAIDNTIKRLDELEGVSNYAKLIGGAFFNPNLFRLLPAEYGTNKSRSYRVVFIKPLKMIINDCLSGKEVSDLEFHIVEFYALTLTRRLEGKDKDSIAPYFRILPEVYYRTDLQNSLKAIFDLGAFFVSITDIQFAYSRIHPEFYSIADKRENSILNQLRKALREREGAADYENNRFLSWCSIRNAVIMQELGESFSYVRTKRTRESSQIDLLRKFFEQVSGFHMKTYDKTEKGDAYDIRFDYAKVFVDLFRELKTNDRATKLFMSVFDDVEKPDEMKEVANLEELGFDVKRILHGLQKEVRKDTLEKKIRERAPKAALTEDFWAEYNRLVESEKITKTAAGNTLESLKNKFNL